LSGCSVREAQIIETKGEGVMKHPLRNSTLYRGFIDADFLRTC
jgi:hypothetical protein